MKWLPENIEIKLNSTELPTATLVSLDLEYDENGTELVCAGIYDGNSYFIYFSPTPRLIEYLRQVNWICVDGIHAELKVLNKLYGGFRAEQIVYDVKLMGYVLDSAAKDWSLKNMAKKYLNVEWPKYSELKKEYKFKSIKELPEEVLIDYNCSDCYYTYKLWQYFSKQFTAQQWEFYRKIELPTNHLIYEMESKGILIDTKEVRRIHNEHSKKRRQAKKKLLQMAGVHGFNPNSPKQVLAVLQSRGISTKTTGEDALKKFKTDDFCQTLLQYRGYQKITSTYTIPLYTEAIKAVDGRIRARFGQNTLTGRLSSSDPINLQNQPSEVRKAFIATDGCQLIGCDWTNIELYLPAHFSGELGLVNVLLQPDGDLHRETAKRLFGQDVESRVDYAEKRQIAKTCNFLLTNSGSANRLSTELNCSKKEAEEIYKKFWQGYPVLAAWIKEVKQKARQHKGVSTMYGRWVHLENIDSWCGRANCPVYDAANHFYCKPCATREAVEREAVSIRVQGSAADICKLAALRLYREYKYVPVALVHDEILIELPEEQIEVGVDRIRETMESIVSLKVPLKAKAKVGKSWAEAH